MALGSVIIMMMQIMRIMIMMNGKEDDDHHGEDAHHHRDVINNDELFDNLHWPPTVCVATRGSKQPRSKVLRGDGIGM